MPKLGLRLSTASCLKPCNVHPIAILMLSKYSFLHLFDPKAALSQISSSAIRMVFHMSITRRSRKHWRCQLMGTIMKYFMRIVTNLSPNKSIISLINTMRRAVSRLRASGQLRREVHQDRAVSRLRVPLTSRRKSDLGFRGLGAFDSCTAG